MPASRFYSSTAGLMTLQIGVSAVTTGLTVDTTVGLPGSTPFTLLLDAGTLAEEIVTVTQVSGTTLVVRRGEDGTSPQAHAAGAAVRHALTARDLRESREHEAAVANVHGTTSAVVGVNDVQALANKNLAAATNVFPPTLATSAALAAEATSRAVGDTAQGTALTTHAGVTATHGATGAVVGTTNVQTLTNKTLASPQFTGTVSGDGDVSIGDAAGTLQRAFRNFRKASTGTKTYEALTYLAGGTTTDTANAVTVLKENNIEVGRIALQADGTFKTNGDLSAVGDITANNISDTGWVSTGFASKTGWSETTSQYRIRNGVCTLNLRFSRSGSAIAVGSTGNVADQQVITIPTAPRTGFNVSGTGVVLTTGGSYGFLYQISSGVLTIIASTNPNVTWNTGADFYTTITYIV